MNQRLTTRLAILAMGSIVNLAQAAPASTKYQVTSMTLVDLGTLGGPDGTSGALDINDLGDVVGYSTERHGTMTEFRPIIHAGGQMYYLNLAPGPGGFDYATGINDNRMVVGQYFTYPNQSTEIKHGFYYYPSVWETEVAKNGHGLGFDWQVGPASVNNNGVIVGYGKIIDPPGLPDAPDTVGICYSDWLPMYWSSAGQNPQALFCYPDPDQNDNGYVGTTPIAYEINDSGDIVGADGGKTTYAMFLKRGSQSPVGVPKPATSPEGLFGAATSISNTGWIVGSYGYDSTGEETSYLRAFIWDGDSPSSTSLGVMTGGTWSVAEGVNNQGMVVGTSEGNVRTVGLLESAFLYHADFGMWRLPSPRAGLCLGAKINNRKPNGLVQAAGTCWFNGKPHAVRWDIQVALVPDIHTSPEAWPQK